MGEIKRSPRIHENEMVELSGEFDLQDLDVLRDGPNEAALRNSVVDLSGVTFMDLQATRELAVHHQFHSGSLSFRHPSQAVLASIAACGYEPWFDFGTEEAGRGLTAGLLRNF